MSASSNDPPLVADSSEFESVLAKALELRDAQCATWLEQACSEHPHLREAIARHAEKASRYPSMLSASLGQDASLGEMLAGRYELLQRLGSGAMGVVYRAKDLELERDVAIKVLRTEMIDPDEAVTRFLREAEVMASIQHPSIITIFDRGQTAGDGPFIVMELLDGIPLSDLLDVARRQEGAAFSDRTDWLGEFLRIEELSEASYVRLVTGWVAEIAAGLEAVHRAGALHRDIKPSNIFIRRDGHPVLLDFGVALRQDHATLTREGAAVGTPVYMAPESLHSNFKPRPTVDVYGLTATLYHMLTLRPPYTGSATQVLASVVSRDPQPASSLRPGLPRDLQAILDKGMERKPRGRYASSMDLESDLRAFLEYRPIEARPISSLERWFRQACRSKLVQGASMVVAAALILFGALALYDWQSERRAEKYNQLVKSLPPNFTIVQPTSRVYRYESDKIQLEFLLDQAAELSREPMPVYLLRSSFRMDHGDLAGAAADMKVVSDHVDSLLATELWRRYAKLADSGVGAQQVGLEDLPQAESEDDLYLMAYHHMRNLDYGQARLMLADPRLAGIDHAQEMRLAMTNFKGLSAAEEKDRASRAFSEVIRLEERQGFRSATTAHLSSRMLLVQGRYPEALEAAREGVALAERSHTVRINAGLMAWRLGLDEEAIEHWTTAIDLQPTYFKPYQNLMWLHLDRGELEEVEMLIDRAPLGSGDSAEQTRLRYRARVETERAVLARGRGDSEGAQEHAQRGAQLLQRASELGALPDDEYMAINAGLLADNPQGVFVGLAGVLAEDPLRWRRLALLLEHMPADLDPDSTQAIRNMIEALHDELASQQQVAPQPPGAASTESATPSTPVASPAATQTPD